MNRKQIIFQIVFFFAFTSNMLAQNKEDIFNQSNSINNAVFRLSKSLEDANPEQLITEYEQVAYEFSANNNYAKAEDYLTRALELAVKNKMQDKQAFLYREIAKTQEEQQKYKEAIASYEKAALTSTQKSQKELNQNDAQRLRNIQNVLLQSEYIQKNIEILETKEVDIPAEKTQAYKKMAEVDVQMNRKEAALQNYEKAIEFAQDEQMTRETQKLKSDLANFYIEKKEFDKAVEMSLEIIDEAKNEDNIQIQLQQMKILADMYKHNNQNEKAKQTLKEAYDIAVQNGRTLDAKHCIELLTDQYQKEGNLTQSIALYSNFLGNLEQLLETDSTLVYSKILETTEGKIAQLEKERELKDQLIIKKNKLNAVLIIFIIVTISMLMFIIRAFLSIKKRNKQIVLQSLRREMNPHFIFNSLNSVNQFIAENNELQANKFLTSYSRLMRNVMENSNKDFIKLEKEIEQIKEYLDLEHLRFTDKFDYKIEIDEGIDTDAVWIPNMILQPNLENAIWHGLRYKKEKGFLKLQFVQETDKLKITIEDNGIGLEASNKIKTKHQKMHKSRGLNNLRERVRLLNDLYNTQILFEVRSKKLPATGTIITIVIQNRHIPN